MRFALSEELHEFEGYAPGDPVAFTNAVTSGDTDALVMETLWRNALGATQKEWDERYREGVVAINRSWDELGDEPLVILFKHSDCDGEIAAQDCAPLADRMEQILELLPKKWDRDAEFYECTLQFIGGLRLAASRNEGVEFG